MADVRAGMAYFTKLQAREGWSFVKLLTFFCDRFTCCATRIVDVGT